ncbi:hypothetical protein MKW92_049733 [Papaver armeniacum]|nr:hypothetical protein MKW92_049733 [Papaver armeniacum]
MVVLSMHIAFDCMYFIAVSMVSIHSSGADSSQQSFYCSCCAWHLLVGRLHFLLVIGQNSVTSASKWEKPGELTLSEQRQQQKLPHP